MKTKTYSVWFVDPTGKELMIYRTDSLPDAKAHFEMARNSGMFDKVGGKLQGRIN